MNTFVEKTAIVDTINGNGPNSTYLSIVQKDFGIELVVGAKYSKRSAMRFTKEGLAYLIEILQEVHEVMK